MSLYVKKVKKSFINQGRLKMIFSLKTTSRTWQTNGILIDICTYIQLFSYETAAWPVYEGKWALFKVVWCSVKVLPRLHLVKGFRPLLRTFKWGTLWCFISRGIKTDTSYRTRVITLLNKVRLCWNFLLWLLVVPMLLWVRHHIVPHLKGLTSGLDP